MIPNSLMMAARGSSILVELKNGETYNGTLDSTDSWMNVILKDAICTSADGDQFWKLDEIIIRGTSVKYIRVGDEIVDKARDFQKRVQAGNFVRGRGRGGRGQSTTGQRRGGRGAHNSNNQ
ncbi:hypothetical protein MIR68_005173 [Amoeboaphelidium protococcarum]|nr:hypothetical protein MIR68_005173 [Amoeboaphelidium protococcarum]KAI3653001.1 hypothetical protein MP228_002426 [Amoeboaphelidium protococcarum]